MSSLLSIAAGSQQTTEFYNFDVNNSLRLDGSTSYLTQTFSAGDRDLYTISFWIKRGMTASGFGASGASQYVFGANDGVNVDGGVLFNTSDQIGFSVNGNVFNKYTNARFRDPSAWYHFVIIYDSSQSTAADRIKIYSNGVEQTSYFTQNSGLPTSGYETLRLNNNKNHTIGRLSGYDSSYLDAYLADFNFIDGQALAPSNFGETKSGVWIPKNTSGLTFGTNGFRLQFGDSSDIGNDTSGQNNDWTATGLSTHDVVPDSPTNNFATFNSLVLDDFTLSEGNLKATSAVAQTGVLTGTMSTKGQKFYCEVRADVVGNGTAIGIARSDYAGTRAYPYSQDYAIYYGFAGNAFKFEVDQGVSWATYTAGDVIGMAIDGVAGTIQFFKNGVSQGTISEATLATDDFLIYAINGTTSSGNSSAYTLNSGQDSTFAGAESVASNTDGNGIGAFHHSVPSGFLAMCAKNITEPSITPLNDNLPEDYFDVVLWEGTGSAQSITGLQFSPNFVWLKNRDHTDWNNLMDTVRTNSSRLSSNELNAEDDGSGIITSFDSNGFSVGTNSNSNRSGDSFVAWNWLAGTSDTGVSNSNGSITSTVSANTEAGFSIVTYTGTGGDQTFGHGLSSAPEIVIVKCRSHGTTLWPVIHKDVAASKYLNLQSTIAETASESMWDSTYPSSTVVSIGGSSHTSTSGRTYLAYCFHSVEGYSKVSSYVGNGAADGTFVYTGFRPAFVIVKRSSATSSASGWFIVDKARNPFNLVDNKLNANSEQEENDSSTIGVSGANDFDFLSNGFKTRATNAGTNTSGNTYIYLAFAEMPFKYANAR